MSRPLIIDAFMYSDEADILELRLTELYDVVDHFVLVEADVTHTDVQKPYHFSESPERFAEWADKIIVVRATDLPTKEEAPDPWAREHAQREWIEAGFASIPHLSMSDIILQSDVDEVPRALYVRNVRPGVGLAAFGMRGHFFAVDWLYPHIWNGTVAGTVRTILGLGPTPFALMRDSRNGHVFNPSIPTGVRPPGYDDAGWHLSWLGGPDRARQKVGSFCHPEVSELIEAGIADDLRFWREGVHVDGCKMAPVDVNDEWPRWIVDGNAPESWYRPR